MNRTSNLVDTEKPIKILYIISRFELGGAEICIFELSRFLEGDVEAGIAAVLGDDRSDIGQSLTKKARLRGVEIFGGVNLPWKLGGFLVSAFKLRRIIKDFQPDIIHLNTEVPEFSFVLCALIDKSIQRIPVIRTIHNTVLWSQWVRLGAWCERKLVNSPVVYVSDAVKSSFQAWRSQCGLGAVLNDAIIYNPISVPLVRESLLNSRILEKKEVRLLFAGRFEYQKGCDLLAGTIENTKVPEGAKLSLQIYGEGSQYELLENLKNNPPPGWHVQIAAPISNLVETLSEFDILLFPSRFEGYGRIAAEAVLTGIPVLAFQLDVLQEIFPADYPWLTTFCEEDMTGFADKLSGLLASLEEAQVFIESARSQLQVKLDQKQVAQATMNIYHNVLQIDNRHNQSDMFNRDKA